MEALVGAGVRLRSERLGGANLPKVRIANIINLRNTCALTAFWVNENLALGAMNTR